VARLILRLNDTPLVGNDIALHLFDVAFCEARYADATQFVAQLKRRLRRYIDKPAEAEWAPQHYKERVGWWHMALGRAAALCRWPALKLTEPIPSANRSRQAMYSHQRIATEPRGSR
jgi:hypothetical protein